VRKSSWLTLLVACAPVACVPRAGTGGAAGAPAQTSAHAASDASGAPAAALVLAPGEVAELHVGSDGRVEERLATPTGTERFVVILASTRFDAPAAPARYSLELGAADPSGASRLVSGCALGPDAWRGVSVSVDPVPTGEGPALGLRRTLSVMTSDAASKIDSEVISIGPHATVIRDLTNPTTLDGAFAEQFRNDFETVIMPRAREVFGTEPDVDGNGRVELVFSRLTKTHGVAFFSACDLLGSLEGCPASNRGEFLYLTPPDAIAPPYNTPNAIKEILTHELSHLLHFNRKVLHNQLSAWTDTVYASEGIGALAQDVVGFQAGNLYVAKAGLDGIAGFSLADVLARKRRPDAVDGVLRGGSYLFFRYLYDRAGGDEAVGNSVKSRGGPAFLRALLDAPESVAEALPRVAAAPTAELALDFYTALALSNREDTGLAAPVNACFTYQPISKDPVTAKQRGTNLFAQFHGMRMAGPEVAAASAADGELLVGGVEYLSLEGAAGQPDLGLRVRVDPTAIPRVRIARWK
jgi:hypothetical protein